MGGAVQEFFQRCPHDALSGRGFQHIDPVTVLLDDPDMGPDTTGHLFDRVGKASRVIGLENQVSVLQASL